ncbi:MAG: nucleotidyl transferase AbiEii/AbiGii toxin family protein [Candidatus Levybacteria bacterium]|nr:nucleotidyl transferase AbiEii/AbiGii toxin family protein [Candidatus Levybacteria bacterium]
MAKTILDSFQQEILLLFKKTLLVKKFYLGGGTALSEFYLKHRLSEDLDFFTQEELNLDELERFINLAAKKSDAKEIQFQHGFGLYTFFLTGSKGSKHKIDFGQYPFTPIEKLRNLNGMLVESLYDIAVNKAHTIAFNPRLRDFIDLYFILQEEKDWSFDDIFEKSFEKFEMRADALQLGQNLLQVKTLADMPVMIKKIEIEKIKGFFLKEAKKLEEKIWK